MEIPKDSTLFTRITWLDSTTHDYGSIPEGRKLDVTYRFLNSGSKPLIIARVQPSCGCTVAEQPEEPILPGKEGLVHISQLAAHRVNRVEDEVNLGDTLTVKVREIDSQGRVNLSRVLSGDNSNN